MGSSEAAELKEVACTSEVKRSRYAGGKGDPLTQCVVDRRQSNHANARAAAQTPAADALRCTQGRIFLMAFFGLSSQPKRRDLGYGRDNTKEDDAKNGYRFGQT